MALRPAHWAGTTIRSHRVPPAGHRATSRRSPSRAVPYALAGLAGVFLAFSVVVGFHLPTGVVPAWESPPAGKLFPLEPVTSSSLPPDDQGISEGVEETGRASRSRSRPADPQQQPPTPPTDAPRPPEAASSTAAAPAPAVTLMPTPGCPPPLPVEPTRRPKASHAPRGPKVQLAATPSVPAIP